MPGYPVELHLTGRLALVVGLGPVGRRKAEGLIEAGARVLGVDPDPPAEARSMGLELLAEPYRPEHLDGVALAFAAATPEVNRRVLADARAAGVWAGSASEPASGDFTLPATWREGPVTLTVSTAGASPALAALLRDRAAGAIGPAAVGLAMLLAELRPIALERVPDPEARRRLLAGWADARWLDLWAEAGPGAVGRALRAQLEAASSSSGSNSSSSSSPSGGGGPGSNQG